MTKRERIFNALNSREVDRVPTLGGWLTGAAHHQALSGTTRQEFWADPEAAAMVRATNTTFMNYDVLNDYAHKDLFELVAYYYKPRFLFYVDVLRRKLLAGDLQLRKAEELEPTYRSMAEEFVEHGYRNDPRDRFPGGAVQAVKDAVGRVYPLDAESGTDS